MVIFVKIINTFGMRSVICVILAISLVIFVVQSDGKPRITQDNSRMLQKQNSLSKGFLSSFFGPSSLDTKTNNNEENVEQQDLENNLDQLAKALPYQMLLPRRKNDFNSPLGLLGNLISAKNRQKSIVDQQSNPLQELNQLLTSRKKKSEKKPFHWENPDFKQGKKDIPIYKIFGSRSKRNHRLQISEEQVQNILANQIPAFRDGELLKLSEASYSKGFFLNVEFLTIKNQVYKVKAKYNEQDNQLQIISMSQLINYEQLEQEISQNFDEEEEDKFIIEELLSEENDSDLEVLEEDLLNMQQSLVQKPVQQPVQTKKQEAVVQKQQKKIVEKAEIEGKLSTPAVQKILKEASKESAKQQSKQQSQIAGAELIKVEKLVKTADIQTKQPSSTKEQSKKQISKEQQKQKQPLKQQNKDQKLIGGQQIKGEKLVKTADIQTKQPSSTKQQSKKPIIKEQQKQKQSLKKQKPVGAQQIKVEKLVKTANIQTNQPSSTKEQNKKQIKEQSKQRQPLKQQNKDQKLSKQAEKIESNLSKQVQVKANKQPVKNVQNQSKDLSKSQTKQIVKPSSDKQTESSIIVKN